MLGLLKYPNDVSKAHGLNQLWYKDTSTTAAKANNNWFSAMHAYLIQSPTVKATFPLEFHWKTSLVFMRTMTKFCMVWNSLTLVRETDDDAIFREAAAGAEKVSLDKISWFMPHVIPADAEKFSVYKTINQKLSYQ